MKISNNKYPILIPTLFILIFLGMLLIFGHLLQSGLAAAGAGPNISIPSQIPAQPDSIVEIPINFISDAYNIASMVFSIDYDQQLLYLDTTVPNWIVFNIPLDFASYCIEDISDLDGEIDCFVYDPGPPPLASIPDGHIATIKLKTVDYPSQILAAANFSTDSPPVSFGNTAGQAVAGTSTDGSVLIKPDAPVTTNTPTATQTLTQTPTATVTQTPAQTSTPTLTKTPTITVTNPPPGSYRLFLPISIKDRNCQNIIVNWSFETNEGWEIVNTAYRANYSANQAHTGERSMRSGILDPIKNVYSYSDFRQYVTIPADAVSAKLNVWLFQISSENETTIKNHHPLNPEYLDNTGAGDAQYILLVNTSGSGFQTLFWDLDHTNIWKNFEFDLIGYKGQTKKLQFGTFNNGLDGISAMYVDDVILEICR